MNSDLKTTRKHLFAMMLLAGLLNACGGGGGSASSPEPEPPAPPEQPEPPVTPEPQPNLYDDFEASPISPERWLDLELRRIPGSLVLELNHSGSQGVARNNSIALANPGSIQSMTAPVKVEATNIEDSVDNNARVRVGLYGGWFNDGTDGDGAIGDVQAEIRLAQSAGGQLQADYSIFRCNTADCGQSTDLVFKPNFAPVAIGQTHTLHIGWDGAQFTFGVDSASESVSPTGVSAANPAKIPFRQIRTRVDRTGSEAESGHIRATIDSVSVNDAPYDDFSSATIDPARWLNHEFDRGITDGKLQSRITTYNGQPATNNLRLVDPEGVSKIGADLGIVAASATDTEPRARIGGYWYDTGLTGEGETGELFAEVGVIARDGQLKGRALVTRCENANCSVGTTVLDDHDTLGLVTEGETHPASIEWNGTRFKFVLGNRELEYQPTGVAVRTGPSETPLRLLGTRIGGTGSGTIHATFDNVVVERE